MFFALFCFVIGLLYFFVAAKRVLSTRVNEKYKRKSFLLTVVTIAGFMTTSLIVSMFAEWLRLDLEQIITGTSILQLFAAAIILFSFYRYKSRGRPVASSSLKGNLPSVSVCIPARNETEDLERCLNTLIASKYPKLEIVVYDDSSQTKKTPEAIKMYANSGVKFVTGKLNPNKWLAKNFAYQRLLEESNGEILVFCGVDTRFEPSSIGAIVDSLRNGVSMVSIMPDNEVEVGPKQLFKYIIQPTRYAWEIGLPRWLVNRPPVLSTCWAIHRNTIEAFGGFEAVARKIVPESYFGRQCFIHNLKYQFIISDQTIGLKNIKHLDEQTSTAVRTRYPQVHRQIENVMLVSLLLFFVFLGPYLSLLYGVLTLNFFITALSALAILLIHFVYQRIVTLTYRENIKKAYFFSPFAALFDIWTLNHSMWQYEFGQVLWKDRDISSPVIGAQHHRYH